MRNVMETFIDVVFLQNATQLSNKLHYVKTKEIQFP